MCGNKLVGLSPRRKSGRLCTALLAALLLCQTVSGQDRATEDLPDPQVLKNSCRSGSSDACNALGTLYLTGQSGLPEDPTEARQYFHQACVRELALGCMNLATVWANGLGGRQNLTEAALLYEKSCRLGNLRGCSAAGYLYATGQGVRSDPAHAHSLLQKACQQDDAPGCLYLGAMQAQANQWQEALAAYDKACELGDGESCNLLFTLYTAHTDIQPDPNLALDYVRKACQLEYAQGCNNEGAVYLQGKIVPRDEELALVRFLRACEGVSMEGCFNAGSLLEQRKQLTEAAEAYDKACRLGNQTACSRHSGLRQQKSSAQSQSKP